MSKTNVELKQKLPDGMSAPAVIQMMQWLVDPLSMLENCAKRYGDIFTLCVSPNLAATVFVSNPIALQEILTGDSTEKFSAPGYKNVTFGTLFGEYSLISLSGAEHQRQRQLLTPPFHGERMRSYAQVINELTEEVMSGLEIGKPFDVRDITQTISLRTIVKVVFGLYEGQRAKQMEDLVNGMMNHLSSSAGAAMLYFRILQKDLGAWSPWGKHVRFQQEIDKLLYSEIQERRKQADSSRTDILSLLMSATDETGESMTDQELRDELLTILIVGQETTATALAWALYWIQKLPEVQEKLLTELDSLRENPDITDLTKLPYLNAVCCVAFE